VRSNGITAFVLQCQTCGQELRAVGSSDPLRRALDCKPPTFDETLSQRYWDERIQIRKARAQDATQAFLQAQEEKQRVWWEQYETYLESEDWRKRRAARLALDQSQCQAQLSGCLKIATQVHHLTYDHLGNEPLFELVSVCWRCHDQITHMDRTRKGRAA
jgi:hypothetical protein